MAKVSRNSAEGSAKHGLVVAALLCLGLSVGFGSWLLRDDDPWWSSTLSNVSVALLLLVPGEMALRWIRSGFRRVERTADEVRATAKSAQTIAERTERSLDDVRQALMDKQVAEHEAQLDVFRDMVREPSRQTLERALRKATDEGVITRAGVRSPVWETDLHYRYVLREDEPRIEVRLETDDGSVISEHPWGVGTGPEDFYQELVLAVRDAGRDIGVRLNDPTHSVEDLSDMLVEVTRLRAQDLMGFREPLSRIIERVNGWYFTERSVIPADDLHYEVAVTRFNEMDWEEHLRGKGWYGASAALELARKLYGVERRQQ
jgi:hypothetical protein